MNKKNIIYQRVEDLGLSNRAMNSLMKANISNLEELSSIKLNEIKGLGAKSLIEIQKLLSLISKNNRDNVGTHHYLIEVDTTEKIYNYIVNLCRAILAEQNDERAFDILKLGFGLEGQKKYSYSDIGEAYDISRERVRQIIESSTELITKVISDKALYYTLRLSPKITLEAQNFYSILENSGPVTIEKELIKKVELHYNDNFDHKKLPELRFIFTLFGFVTVPSYLFGQSIKTNDTWILSKTIVSKNLINTVLKIRDILRQSVVPMSTFDLKINLNKGQRKKISSEYIALCLPICSEIEKLDSNEYQQKFEWLSTLADKAFRILLKSQSPMHINDILKEINHNLIIAGRPAKALIQSLRGELINDSRFDVVGKSSVYFLKQWNNISKLSIAELIEEHFIISNTSTNFSKIFDYVKKKRTTVDRKSVYTILVMNDKFIKVDRNLYELKSWGGKKYSVAKTIRKDKVRAIILEYFQKNKTNNSTLPELRKYVEHQTFVPSATFYSIVNKLPFLTFIKSENSNMKKVLFNSEQIFSGIEEQKNENKVDLVETIFEYLDDKLDPVLLKELRDFTVMKTKVDRSTFYKLVQDIDGIQKEKIGNKIFVKIKELSKQNDLIEDEYKYVIANLSDIDLKIELEKIFKYLSTDRLDIVFFSLGRIFENEIKEYLMHLSKKGEKISDKIFKTLSNMIRYINDQKIVKNDYELSILRVKRNECAHEIISGAEERKLRKHAPFYIDLFLKYIFFFNKLRNQTPNNHVKQT